MRWAQARTAGCIASGGGDRAIQYIFSFSNELRQTAAARKVLAGVPALNTRIASAGTDISQARRATPRITIGDEERHPQTVRQLRAKRTGLADGAWRRRRIGIVTDARAQ
jgi:hypothetical protein